MATRTKRRAQRTRHDGWTAARRKRFLEVLSLTANVTRAVQAAGMSRTTAYALYRRDPAFADAWDAALEESLDDLFTVMMGRARNGSTRTITVAGKPVKTVHDYSDRLGMFLLARYRPTLHAKLAKARARATPSPAAEIDFCRTLAEAYHAEPIP